MSRFLLSKRYFINGSNIKKLRLKSIDLHAAGEPARVIVGGLPDIPGTTMSEKRNSLIKDFDCIRKILITEPRGYPCQNANLIFPSLMQSCKYGYVILEQNKIYPLMSGKR